MKHNNRRIVASFCSLTLRRW